MVSSSDVSSSTSRMVPTGPDKQIFFRFCCRRPFSAWENEETRRVTDVERLAEESLLSADRLAIYVRASSEALHSSMPIFRLFSEKNSQDFKDHDAKVRIFRGRIAKNGPLMGEFNRSLDKVLSITLSFW